MSALRPVFRGSAVVGGLVLVAGLTMSTTSATASPTAAPRAAAPHAASAASASTARTASNARWSPPRSYVPYNGPRFGYLARGKSAELGIRNTVLATIQSTWGGPRDRYGLTMPGNGTIRIATWSFGDMGIAKALVAAKNRGVSVQVMSASDINKTHPEWRWLKKRLGTSYFKSGISGSAERTSFARSLQRLLPRPGRYAAREVLPVQQRGREPRQGHHDLELDEPDRIRLAGPVERGPGQQLDHGLQRLHGRLPRDAAGDVQRLAVPRLLLQQGPDREHLLPDRQLDLGHRPGAAHAQQDALHERRGLQRPDPHPDHPVRHLPVARRADRQDGCASCGTRAATSRSSTR